MNVKVLLLALLMLMPCAASASVYQTFEQYTSNADWIAQGRGGWVLNGAADFELADNPVNDGVNSSSKCLHITSAPGTADGGLTISFTPLQAGAFSFKVYSPAVGGAPFNYAGWAAGGDNPSLFHGMFYEYSNDAYFQYGNAEPYGGFAQGSAGVLSGGWHTISGSWTATGRLTMWYDGVKKVDNVPLRNDLGSGLTYINFWTPDGSGSGQNGTNCYIDDVRVWDGVTVVEQTFDAYADNAAWVASGRSGWQLTGAEEFVLATNPKYDATNPSSKVLHIVSGSNTPGGTLKINFDALPSGTLTYKVYSPAVGGAPWNMAYWAVYGDAAGAVFHGMFYEYMNEVWGQYGNVEPYGGFEQKAIGYMNGRWHTVHITWSEDGRVNMWEDGVKAVDNKPMREALGAGVRAFSLASPDGSNGADTYIDDLVVKNGVTQPSTSINYDFEPYANNADWLNKGRGGWVLANADEFQVVNTPVKDAVNSSDRCLRIVSAPGTPNGTLRIDFDAITNGEFGFDVYSPAQTGVPYNACAWATYGTGEALFHGMFYEYSNDAYIQYGNVEPFGGFTQKPMGILSGGWHKAYGSWTFDGRLTVYYDGVKQVDNAPMRSALDTGLSRFLLASADGSPGCDTYIDNVFFRSVAVEQVAKPEFTPDGGTYAVGQSVSMTCATEGARIYYTTDGNQPDENCPEYTGAPVQVDQTTVLKARAFKAGANPSDTKMATYVIVTEFNRPGVIKYSDNVTINGDLDDWADAQWAPLDSFYNGYAWDISEAYYAAKWGASGNKIYIAVKVKDTAPWFTSVYQDWNVRDAVEMYIHTTGTGAKDYSANQAIAQEYTVGMKPLGVGIWSTVGYNPPNGNNIPSGAFQAAGKLGTEAQGTKDWIFYEAAITPYHKFSLDGQGLEISTLSAGQVIGLDAAAVAHSGTAYTGMMAENYMTGKSGDYTMFGLHLLVVDTDIAGAKEAADGAGVVVTGIVSADFGDYFYIEDANRTYGIRVEKTGHGLTVGNGVSVTGIVSTLGSGERSVKATLITPAVDGDIKPVGLTNKALGGATFRLQSGVVDGSGLNNIGLLIKTTGRVGEKGDGWFKVDDGSGVSVKVLGSAPAGNPHVAVTGISSCEKVDNAILRAIIATSVVEMAQ